jgi:hypothetical protein
MRRVWSSALALATLVAAASASAQQARDPVAAEALFRDAREAFKKGDYATACPKFAESHRLDPAAGALFNLADCEERAGHLATAWLRWQELVDLLRPTPEDDRFDVAQKHVKDLAPRLPRLRVRWAGAPVEDAVVKRDGVELGSASFGAALPIDAGKHVVEVTAPGRAPRSFTVQTTEGATADVEISASEAKAGTPVPPPVTPPKGEEPKPPKTSSGGSALPALGWTGVGLGVVALGIGIGTGAAAAAAKSTVGTECNAYYQCSQAGLDAATSGRALATTSTVTIVLGSILTATGIGFLVVGAATRKPTAARVLPLLGPTMGAALEGRF